MTALVPLTKYRGKYKDALNEIIPWKIIAPFGFDIEGYKNLNLKIIVTDKKCIKRTSPSWEYRTNKQVHAKIAIGNHGILLGSWNFTNNSTHNRHEAAVAIGYDDTTLEFFQEYNVFFDEIWARGKEVEDGDINS